MRTACEKPRPVFQGESRFAPRAMPSETTKGPADYKMGNLRNGSGSSVQSDVSAAIFRIFLLKSRLRAEYPARMAKAEKAFFSARESSLFGKVGLIGSCFAKGVSDISR